MPSPFDGGAHAMPKPCPAAPFLAEPSPTWPNLTGPQEALPCSHKCSHNEGMTQAIPRPRHGRDLSPQSLPPTEIDTYDAHVADSKDLRRFRLDAVTWKAYGDLVGDGGRSADLKAYID